MPFGSRAMRVHLAPPRRCLRLNPGTWQAACECSPGASDATTESQQPCARVRPVGRSCVNRHGSRRDQCQACRLADVRRRSILIIDRTLQNLNAGCTV